jgi:hypothetical protein
LQRQQAREKALEDKRIRVILFSLNPNWNLNFKARCNYL